MLKIVSEKFNVLLMEPEIGSSKFGNAIPVSKIKSLEESKIRKEAFVFRYPFRIKAFH